MSPSRSPTPDTRVVHLTATDGLESRSRSASRSRSRSGSPGVGVLEPRGVRPAAAAFTVTGSSNKAVRGAAPPVVYANSGGLSPGGPGGQYSAARVSQSQPLRSTGGEHDTSRVADDAGTRKQYWTSPGERCRGVLTLFKCAAVRLTSGGCRVPSCLRTWRRGRATDTYWYLRLLSCCSRCRVPCAVGAGGVANGCPGQCLCHRRQSQQSRAPRVPGRPQQRLGGPGFVPDRLPAVCKSGDGCLPCAVFASGRCRWRRGDGCARGQRRRRQRRQRGW